MDVLQKRFYELSRELHPDRFMRKPEAERQHALDLSSTLNDAYRTLKDPLKRAHYLLSQEGFDIGEQRSKDVPPELLEEVFELNMALEEMRGGRRFGAAAIGESRKQFHEYVERCRSATGGACSQQYDAGPVPRHAGARSAALLNRRKYIQNLVDEVQKMPWHPANSLCRSISAAAERVVGIDLGTTNSLVAFMDLTGPSIIPGADGDKLVPERGLDPAQRRCRGRQCRRASCCSRIPSAQSTPSSG